MVVFVDELDRCKPDTVLDIFEAMRLFLFVKGSSFVIGADSRLIDYAIKSRYKNIPGNNLDISKEYLEKLIQYPVNIPQLDKNELEKYLTCLLLEKDIENVAGKINNSRPYDPINVKLLIDGNSQEEESIKEALALSRQVSPILAAKLNGNPRQCKRFFNALFMRISMAESRGITLDKNVLAKLMLLEYFKESMYAMVVDPTNSKDLEELESNNFSEDNVFKKWATDDWVKEWLAIDVKLSGINLRDYYYFSRSTQRVDMSIKELLSPDAQKCLDFLLDKTDSNRRTAIALIPMIATNEVSIILDSIYDKMISLDEIDTDWFKSYIEVLSVDSMLPQASDRIKHIPLEKYNSGIVAQMLTLLPKVTQEQKNEITTFLSQKSELASVLERADRFKKISTK
jgi:predicted KAP-like P-loop ATPase